MEHLADFMRAYEAEIWYAYYAVAVALDLVLDRVLAAPAAAGGRRKG